MPPDPTKISGRIYFCTSCNNYLLSTQFPLNVNARNPGNCQQCKKKDNEGRYRTDYSSYRHMLKVLRMTEEQYNDGSTIAFIFQVTLFKIWYISKKAASVNLPIIFVQHFCYILSQLFQLEKNY